MCSGKMGKALKFSIFDRSVALPERRHRLPLPVAISLDVSCYSYNLPLFILQPIASSECQYVIKVWQTSKTKSGCSSPTQIQWSVCSTYHEKGWVNLYAWEVSPSIFHLRPQGWMRWGIGLTQTWLVQLLDWHPACWLWNVPACKKHAAFFHFTNQCKAPNQRRVFAGLM